MAVTKSKKKNNKKSNISFIKTLCALTFFVSALGIYYSAYSGTKDMYIWLTLLLINCIAVFSPDEIKK